MGSSRNSLRTKTDRVSCNYKKLIECLSIKLCFWNRCQNYGIWNACASWQNQPSYAAPRTAASPLQDIQSDCHVRTWFFISGKRSDRISCGYSFFFLFLGPFQCPERERWALHCIWPGWKPLQQTCLRSCSSAATRHPSSLSTRKGIRQPECGPSLTAWRGETSGMRRCLG